MKYIRPAVQPGRRRHSVKRQVHVPQVFVEKRYAGVFFAPPEKIIPEFSGDDGDGIGPEIGKEISDHHFEPFGVAADEIGVSHVSLSLVPDYTAQRRYFHRHTGLKEGVLVKRAALLPAVEGGPSVGAGD